MKKIVLIDDNEIDLFVNRKLIEMANLNMDIHDFQDPKKALQFLKNEKQVAVILVDHQMSDYTGYSFIKEYLESSNSTSEAEPKLAILTASADAEARLHYDKISREVAVWEKPLNIELLKLYMPS